MLNEQEPYLWEYLRSAAKPVVFYGTGDGADKVLAVAEKYGVKPGAVAASDGFTRGKTFRGFEVKPISEVKKSFKDFIVLICFGTDKEDVLEGLYALSREYETFAPDVPVVGGDIYDAEYLSEHGEKLAKSRELLSDAKSREVFDGWLKYRISGRIEILDEICSLEDEAVSLLGIKSGGGEFFVDAGACKGDTVDLFLRITGKKFKKIIAIEPDAKNFMALRRRFYALGSGVFIPVNAAAWSEDATLEFTAKTGRGGAVYPGRGRRVEVAAVKIDGLCAGSGDKPTFIKIDAEGAEGEILAGAANVVSKYRPKMSVALYHRAEDMYALPLKIHSLNPRYKMYLRKARCVPGWGFNLYAV
ncbi:MAG: FkbM family methyltransferase [Oscillospiraceae bacterium]|jgi:FkbM family methyltransferase|nr:FkbM family methyltransferase [Oscillospiraceae bacterium]